MLNDVTAVRVFGRCHGSGRGQAARRIVPISRGCELPCPISRHAHLRRHSVPSSWFLHFAPASFTGNPDCPCSPLFNFYSQHCQYLLMTQRRERPSKRDPATIMHVILTFSRRHAYSSMVIQKVPPSVSYRGPTHLFGSCPGRRRFPDAPGGPASFVSRAGIKRGPKPAHFGTTTRPHGNLPVRSVRFLGREVNTGPQACA